MHFTMSFSLSCCSVKNNCLTQNYIDHVKVWFQCGEVWHVVCKTRQHLTASDNLCQYGQIWPWCTYTMSTKKLGSLFLAISQLLLGQIQKVRSDLKSAGSENFKTVLTFDIWQSRSWVNWGVIFCFHIKMKIFPVLAVMITCLHFWNSIWHYAILNNE